VFITTILCFITLKKLLAGLAAVVATAAPAQANDLYRLLDSQPLTQMVRSTGTTVLYDTARCDKGMLGYYRLDVDVMVLCVANHKGDIAELGDTLRHESIHIAQACNGGKAILPWNTIAKYSNNRILSIVQRYPIEHQHVEYEAFTAAYVMNNNQIKDIVEDFCFE
jgi:hypothetical protein